MEDRQDAHLMQQVRREQVRMAIEATPFSVMTVLIVSTILAVLHWPVVDGATIQTWVVAVYLVSAYRLLVTLYFLRADPPADRIRPWSIAVRTGAFLAALIWGSAGFFLFASGSPPHQILLALMIAGVSAGGVASMAAMRGAAFGFVFLVNVPLAYRFFEASDGLGQALPVVVLVFIVFMLSVAHRFNRNLTAMIVERYKRQLSQQREKTRTRVLELLAQAAPLKRILKSIVHGIEDEDPSIRGSILLLDESGSRLVTAAAPSLPLAYVEAVDGLEIGMNVGSCGTTAYTRKRFIVEDIAQHPAWEPYRQLAARTDIASAWSEPILASSGRLLGTLTLYGRAPHHPDARELSMLSQAANLASIAIERSKTEEALRLAALVYEKSSEAMMITDEKNRIVAINPAFVETTGYTQEEVVGKQPNLLQSGRHDRHFFESMWEELHVSGRWQGEIWNRRKNGEVFPEWLTINTIHDPQGRVHRRVALFSDITEKKKADELIWTQANYDALTHLPNRRLFVDRLEQSIRRASRDRERIALLYIDLDRFKEVNDTLGHTLGDELLVEASKRLGDCVRDSDTVARIGGDEFTVILNELKDVDSLCRIAKKLLEVLSDPYQLREEQAYLSASIGITVFPDDGTKADVLLKNADQAMFAAKQDGRNRFNHFTGAMQEAANRRMRLVRDLHRALARNQFQVYYQPVVDLATGRIEKAEALLRWEHPERGFISPADFIPVAEETGAIHQIGNYIFKEATLRAREWRKRYHPGFQISVNRSPVQFFADGPTEDDWLEHLQSIQMPGEAVVVEITEGVLLRAAVNINEKLLRLRDAGIQVAIDDFGTGYSSLAYLKRFDIDYLKIDRTFVSSLETDSSDRAVSEAIVVMAHKLGFKVIAEGVETEGQQRILTEIGCDYGQGYLFSPPIPTIAFESMLEIQDSSRQLANG
ncbi:putative bifunctional diguanylate cyclase/phosphodiesterase [Thioalkalivibrio sp.]|uniref:putative bifunctional diguanylate cyclase/phosphodiesterase n=1 Tax=Thioalkalivibrio sp. TaxID=2093813 RepID=UPI00356B39D3